MTLFSEDAKSKIVAAVKDVESKSSAEIVVALRARSDEYRESDLLFGFLAAMATLAILIWHPAELDEDLMPGETLLAFVVVSLLVNKIPALKRLCTPKKRQAERTSVAARAHFVDAGISRTRDRSGILVFVSELERAVCVVTDIGIDVDKLGEGWRAAVQRLEQSALSLDPGAFTTALNGLGPILGATYPRRADDVNELPDAPTTS